MKKFKPFSGFCPVPVLPSSQVAATSYAQHLAYLEWYMEKLQKLVTDNEVEANPETTGDEPDLSAIKIAGETYLIPEGGSGGDAYTTGTFNVIINNVTISGGYWEKIGKVIVYHLPSTMSAISSDELTSFSLSPTGDTTLPASTGAFINLSRIVPSGDVPTSGELVDIRFRFRVQLGIGTCDVISCRVIDPETNMVRYIYDTSVAYYLQYVTPTTFTVSEDA